jgi:hypothetical protein
MTKLFKVGGITKSAKHGYKVRFATDMTRVKILAKTETDIQLMELPTPMDKPALVAFLKSSELYANPAYREAIDMADAQYNGVVKVTKAKASKPSMEAIKARATKSTKEAVAE